MLPYLEQNIDENITWPVIVYKRKNKRVRGGQDFINWTPNKATRRCWKKTLGLIYRRWIWMPCWGFKSFNVRCGWGFIELNLWNKNNEYRKSKLKVLWQTFPSLIKKIFISLPLWLLFFLICKYNQDNSLYEKKH